MENVNYRADRNMPAAAYAFDSASLAMLIASFSAVLVLGFDLLILAGYVGILYTLLTWFGVISVTSGVLGSTGYALSDLLGQAPPDKRSFVKVSLSNTQKETCKFYKSQLEFASLFF